MSRTSRSAHRLWVWLGAAGVSLGALVAVALFLVYTETGSRWLLGWAQGRLPKALTYESFEGTIAGPFEVRGLEYSFGQLRGRIESARVHWQPWKLVDNVVQLDSVRVTGARLSWDTAQAPPDRDSISAEARDSSGWQVRCDLLTVSGGVLEGPHGLTLHDVEMTSGGGPDSFHVALGARVIYDSLPECALAVAGDGDLDHLEFREFTLTRDSTLLAVQGRVEWKPSLSWDVTAQVEGLDPSIWSRHLSRLHGSVRLVASSRGRVEAGAPDFTLIVDTLSGLLEGSPLAGYSSLQVLGPAVSTDSTWIDWRGFSARAQGRYADSVHLVWDVRVPELSLMWDECGGSLWAHGEAHGPRERLAVNASFAGGNLVFRDFRADTTEGEVAWSQGGAMPSKLGARLLHVKLPNWVFDSISLEVTGTRAAHQGRVSVAGPNGGLYSKFVGRHDSLWQGRLDTVVVEGERPGWWHLTEPAGMVIGPGRVEVSEFCLEGDRGRLCAAGAVRSGDDWELGVEFQSMALDWLSRLVLTGVVFDSRLSGQVRMSSASGTGVSAEAQLAIIRGLLTMDEVPEDTITTDSLVVDFYCTPEAGRLQASGGMALRGEHTPFALEVELPGSTRIRTELAADTIRWQNLPWSGSVDVNPLALGILDRLLPEDSHLDGRASVHLEAASGPGGRIVGNCVLQLPPGHMLVPTGTDTLLLDWAASVLDVRADSSGTSAEIHSALSAAGRSVGTLDVNLSSPQGPAWGQNPMDLPLQGTASAHIDLAPLDPFVYSVTGLQGEFNVNTSISGTPRDLALEGSLDLTAEAFLQDLGIQLSGVRLSMQSAGGNTTVSGSATSAGGTLELTGSLSRLPSRESPSHLKLRGEGFGVLESRQASVWITPDLELVMFGDSLELTGSVAIPQARIEIVKLPKQAVPGSPDEVILGDTLASGAPRLPFGARVQVSLGNQVFFKGFDVTTFLDGSLEVRQQPGAAPEGRGEVVLRDGRYRGMGQDLQVDPGRLIFSGPLYDPTIDAIAYRRAADHTKAGFKVSGRLTSPQVDLYSDPMKPDNDIMAYILFGRSSGEGSDSERLKASEAAAYLGGNLLASQAATQIGLDEARIDPGYSGTDAALVAGKYLSPQLFVGYGTGLFESLHTLRVRYIVSTHISLQAETGTRETADVIYQIERGE